jgi:RNA polymerase sigma-70 factor, ECF subfamily
MWICPFIPGQSEYPDLIHGAKKTARMLARIALTKVRAPVSLYCGLINGMPGFVTKEPDGLPQVTVLEMEDERIAAAYIIRNPEKLGAIAAVLGL